MMTTPDSDLSYKIFRAHEMALERLECQVSEMKKLTRYATKREEILQARAKNEVPDERTRLRIERELPKFTSILLDRISRWEDETGLVFRWKDKPYLAQMRSKWLSDDKNRKTKKVICPSPSQTTHHSEATNQRRIQCTNRHSIEDRAPSRISAVKDLTCRRSDPQVLERPRWRTFIRNTFSRRDASS